MTLKKVLSVPCLSKASVSENYSEMKKSKSDSNLLKLNLSKKQKLKSIIFLRRKVNQDGRKFVNGLQDIQFANEIVNSNENIMKSIALTALMAYSIENDEERLDRIKLIIGTMVLLELMKYT